MAWKLPAVIESIVEGSTKATKEFFEKFAKEEEESLTGIFAPLEEPALVRPTRTTTPNKADDSGALASTAWVKGQFEASNLVGLENLAKQQPFPVTIPDVYGALGNGKQLFDVATTSASAKVTSASKGFKEAKAGQLITICGCGEQAKVAGSVPGAKIQRNSLTTEITKVNSETEVEVKDLPKASVTNALALFASDDTAHIQEAITEAVKQAKESGKTYCEVWFNHAIYGIAGALKETEGAYAQIVIPLNEAPYEGTTANLEKDKITLVLKGSGSASALPLWYNRGPQQAGALLYSFGPWKSGGSSESIHAQPEYSNTRGRPAVIGGPTPEQGYGGLKFSNYMIVIDGLTMSAPTNSTMTELEFNGMANLEVKSLGSFAMAIPDYVGTENTSTGGSGKYAENVNEFVVPWKGMEGKFAGVSGEGGETNTIGFARPACALASPLQGNNDNSMVYQHSVEGKTSGIEIGEHSVHVNMRTVYGLMGGNVGGTSSGLIKLGTSWYHPCTVLQWSIEDCVYGIYAGKGVGQYMLNIFCLDSENGENRWENTAEGKFLYDPENGGRGIINVWFGSKAALAERSGEAGSKLDSAAEFAKQVTGALGLSIRLMNWGPGIKTYGAHENPTNINTATGMPSLTVPATTVAFKNPYFRDAVVFVKAGTAEITAIEIDGVATGLKAAASGSAVPVPVPSGRSITLTYASGTPTWTWSLTS